MWFVTSVKGIFIYHSLTSGTVRASLTSGTVRVNHLKLIIMRTVKVYDNDSQCYRYYNLANARPISTLFPVERGFRVDEDDTVIIVRRPSKRRRRRLFKGSRNYFLCNC